MQSRRSGESTISFIVPALNAEATLALCLDAILAARTSGRRREVLVIDNGSMDQTAEIARGRGVRVMSAPGLTIAAIRNLGAHLAEGEVLAYVDADCVIAPDWLEKALVNFADPNVGAVGSSTHIPAGATWVQRAWGLHRHRQNRRGSVEWLPTENLLIRKTAFQEVGGFNEALVTCEDVDFCYRLGARYKIVNDPAIRSVHLGEATTLTKFFRKEAWRGTGNITGFLSHRFRASELPSLLLPAYHVVWAVALIGAIGYWVSTGTRLPVVVASAMLLGPSLLLGLSTAVRVRQIRCWPRLMLLYVTYAAARSTAMVAAFTPLRGDSRRDRHRGPGRQGVDTGINVETEAHRVCAGSRDR